MNLLINPNYSNANSTKLVTILEIGWLDSRMYIFAHGIPFQDNYQIDVLLKYLSIQIQRQFNINTQMIFSIKDCCSSPIPA